MKLIGLVHIILKRCTFHKGPSITIDLIPLLALRLYIYVIPHHQMRHKSQIQKLRF